MNGERVMRDWYAPLEIATLSTWLNVAIVVNIILLTFDVLRGDGMTLSLLGILSLALLAYYLPDGVDTFRRDVSLVLAGVCLLYTSPSPRDQ